MNKFLTRKFCQNILDKYSKVLIYGRNNMENMNINIELGQAHFIKYIISKGLDENKTNPLLKNTFEQLFPQEEYQNVKSLNEIAQQYLDHFVSLGAYTDSQGSAFCLQNLANSIQQRDGIAIEKNNLNITSSSYILFNLLAAIGNKNDKGAMLTPQVKDPVYSQILKNNNTQQYHYWDLGNDQELLSSLDEGLKKSKKEGKRVYAVFLQSPHGVSGKTLTKKALEDVIEFCYNNNLMLVTDESYQLCQLPEQVLSTRKIMHQHPNQDIKKNLELITMCNSYRSLIPNAIFQGAISTLENLDPDVQAVIIKLQSMMLCCATTQQIYTDLIFQLHYGKGLFDEKYQKLYNTVIKENASLLSTHQNQLLYVLNKIDTLKILQSDCGHDMLVQIDEQDDIEFSQELLQRSSVRVQPGSKFRLPGFVAFSKLQHYQGPQLDQLENALSEMLNTDNQFII